MSNFGAPGQDVSVLMAVPQYPYPVTGGLERQSHELSKALLKLGVHVQAVSGAFAGQQSQETVEGIVVHRIPWPRRKLLRFFRTPFALFSTLHRHRHTYDVVHLHQFSWFGAFVILTARILRKPILTKLPSVGPTSLPGVASSRFGTIKLAIFKLSDAVVTMSGESLDELAAVDYPLHRALRTPNGIRVMAPRGPELSGTARLHPCRVVFVGRLSEEKRVADLLHAWQLVVRETTVPASLELWGDGPDEAALKALSATLGIADSVVFRGHMDSVSERLKEMDVFVLTSVREGNSNAILEAMAAGLPVVSTKVGGTPMLVGAEGAELLVQPGDREGLSRRLIDLVEDVELRRAYGTAMHTRILEHFDIQRVARTYAGAYRILTSGWNPDMTDIGNPIIARDQEGS